MTFLARLNPLATLIAPLPGMVVLAFSRNLTTPAVVMLFAIVTVILGSSLRLRTLIALLGGTALGVAIFSVSIGVWVDPTRTSLPGADVVLWQWARGEFTLAAYLTGLAAALRLAALFWLALVAGVASNGPRLIRSLIQNLRVPYRVGYVTLAALRFVPRFRAEYASIRIAHRMRGLRGPQLLSYAVPLLAGSLRHAERVALAMDARAFGARSTRTERYDEPWTIRDSVFCVGFVSLILLVIVLTWNAV